MKIGVIASIAHAYPPENDGSWDHVASTLTEGFVARGHDVVLFASADSRTAARLHGTAASGDQDADRALHCAAAFERAAEFDILVNHAGFAPVTYSRLVSTPMVTTIHGSSARQLLPAYQAYDDVAHKVAPSVADRHPDLRYDATILPGIDPEQFTFVPEPGDYLLLLGPIHPDNGTHLAIDVAQQAKAPLVIAGNTEDESYYRESVEPHLDGVGVSYLGPVKSADRDALLGGARALLHLSTVADQFALPAIEALATGTPVIATPLGSMPEIIQTGTTGYLVPDVASAVSAVARIADLDRRACRDEAVSRFGADRMIDEYVALFARITGVNSAHHPSPTKRIGSPGLFSHTSS
ncbi:MAG: glycosyltransferase family 4 protein [Geodermatophilaceae bacterium]|nr:glycosyltransferase family 4 protein [Geodermatophilaceae bacterium]